MIGLWTASAQPPTTLGICALDVLQIERGFGVYLLKSLNFAIFSNQFTLF